MVDTVDNLGPSVSTNRAIAEKLSREKIPAAIIKVKGTRINPTAQDFLESVPTETAKEFGQSTPGTYAMLPGSPDPSGRQGLYLRRVFIGSIDFEEFTKRVIKDVLPKSLPSPEKVIKLQKEASGIDKNSIHVGNEVLRYSKS